MPEAGDGPSLMGCLVPARAVSESGALCLYGPYTQAHFGVSFLGKQRAAEQHFLNDGEERSHSLG